MFNATYLLTNYKHLKPYHFTDNLRIRKKFPTILHDRKVEGKGRNSATYLPDYCKEAFEAWLELQTKS